jgi:ABC-2 type transport system permease protein
VTTTVVRERGEVGVGRLPGAWGLGLRRGALEIRQFFRQRDQVVFTFAFPVVFLFLFASIFRDDVEGAGINASQPYVPAMMAAGIMSTIFQALGLSIAIEREDKVLRRLRGTPMPTAAYFLGKIWLVLFTGLLETAVLLLVGTTCYGVNLPSDAGRWLDLAWIFVLGIMACRDRHDPGVDAEHRGAVPAEVAEGAAAS